MADVIVGCCGWSEARSLYFQHLGAVELQATFYEPPAVELAQKWRAEAPRDFVFTLKAWQLITHPATSPTYRRLKSPLSPEQASRCGFFHPTPEVLGAWQRTMAIASAVRAAAIVFQCPASFAPTQDNVANIKAFFSTIGDQGLHLVWEPRGQWPSDLIEEICRDLRLVHCVDPFTGQPVWGDIAYFRLHGRTGYRYRYSDDDLRSLREICLRQLDLGRTSLFCMFNNVYMRDDALRFLDILASG